MINTLVAIFAFVILGGLALCVPALVIACWREALRR